MGCREEVGGLERRQEVGGELEIVDLHKSVYIIEEFDRGGTASGCAPHLALRL